MFLSEVSLGMCRFSAKCSGQLTWTQGFEAVKVMGMGHSPIRLGVEGNSQVLSLGEILLSKLWNIPSCKI